MSDEPKVTKPKKPPWLPEFQENVSDEPKVTKPKKPPLLPEFQSVAELLAHMETLKAKGKPAHPHAIAVAVNEIMAKADKL